MILNWYLHPTRPGYLEAYDTKLGGMRWIQIGWPEDLTRKIVRQWQANGKQGTLAREGPVRIQKRADNS